MSTPTICSQDSSDGCARIGNAGFVFVVLSPLLPGLYFVVSILVALWEQVEFEDRQREAMTQHYRAQYESRSARVAPVERERLVERERANHQETNRRASTGTIAGTGPSRAAQQAAVTATASSLRTNPVPLTLTGQLDLAQRTVKSSAQNTAGGSEAAPAGALQLSITPANSVLNSNSTPAAGTTNSNQLDRANVAAVMQGAGPPAAMAALEMTPLTRSKSADGL